jgi:NAD(P)-dependent dehydrogenase (short-subunit alcohol dehydrogenase family)
VDAELPLTGRHAVITGASRGIGAAIATRLAGMGAQTTLIGRDRRALERQASGDRNARAVVCDVTDPAQVERAFAEARERMPIAILINNAGAAESAPFQKTSDAMLERMLAVNLGAAFRCARSALPSMIETGWGRIVNISSIAGLRGYPYVTAYVAAKHALVGFTRALAMETARKGITVNAVCPGYTDTELVRNSVATIVAKTGRSESEALHELIRHNPQARLIRPEEVADAVAWLCGPGADSITGQAIAVAGGEIM